MPVPSAMMRKIAAVAAIAPAIAAPHENGELPGCAPLPMISMFSIMVESVMAKPLRCARGRGFARRGCRVFRAHLNARNVPGFPIRMVCWFIDLLRVEFGRPHRPSCFGWNLQPDEAFEALDKHRRGVAMGRYLLLWLLGVPIPILVLIWAFGGLH